jgi:hypothetical protein
VAQAFLAGALEHGLAKIGAGDRCARAGAFDCEGQVAAARGQVENGARMP